MAQQSTIRDLPITTALVAPLESSDPVVRARSAEALGRRAPIRADAAVVRRLARLSLEDEDSAARAAAVNALIRLEVPVEEIRANALELLTHPSREVRARAGWTMGRFEPADIEPAVPALSRALLTDTDADPKFGALWAFARMRSCALDILAALERALEDENGDVRSEAARVLGRLGSGAAPAVPALTRVLDDIDPLARANAARAIGLIGSDDTATLEELRARCSDPIDYVGAEAAAALERCGTPAPEKPVQAGQDPWLAEAPPVDELMARLDGDDAFRRAEASWLIAKRGSRSTAVTDALARRAVVDPDSDSRWAALYALERIGVPSRDLTETVAGILDGDVDPDVRQSAAAALAVHWPEAPDTAFDALASALTDEDPMVRDEAADALAMIGPPARVTRPALQAALEDPHAGVRARAAEALASVGAS